MIETTIEEPNNGKEAVEQLLVDESNGIIDRWMSENPVSNKFVYIGSPCLPDKGGNIRIEQVIASFDTMEYYRKEGSIKYETINEILSVNKSDKYALTVKYLNERRENLYFLHKAQKDFIFIYN